MITTFKIFEKLGVNKLTLEIVEKMWKQIEDAIDKKETQTIVDISEFNINILKPNEVYINGSWQLKNTELVFISNIIVSIYYNRAIASVNIIPKKQKNKRNKYYVDIMLGIENKEYDTKELLTHEIKHLVDRTIKSKILYSRSRNEFFSDDTKRIFKGDIVDLFIHEVRFGSIASITDLTSTTDGSESYKKFLVYCYLANEDELSARLHEFYLKVKKSKNLLNTIKEEENKYPLKYYKDMCNFNFNFDELSKTEKNNIGKYFDNKNIKKVEAYIRKQGQIFIKKLHKFSYFEEN
jgi:hypothetical protein